ncbi:SRPBCC family protein [Pseudoalteromonas spongiae]|uniref:SRPBCC family protein n=1 Tax=Pseudoalteromonas spongiae TaxID=298657 RepID=UPI0002E9A8AA|nr:SRPBCC family protein [Pseudoalteromonas spongiae]
MISVQYQKTIQASPDQIFTKLIDHENLNQFFNASFKVVKPQDNNEPIGGKGCVRQISLLGITFLEEIIHASEREIRYRVLNDFPVKDHLGVFTLQPHGKHTIVTYTIQCNSPWYLPGVLLRRILANDIRNCLDKLGAFYDPS